MGGPRSDILQGTLQLFVLKVLSTGPMHGWGIAQRIEAMSRGVFSVNQGSLYPALQRMLRQGWVKSQWRTTENGRRARYYTLTPAGLRQLPVQMADWSLASIAVNWVLNT
jgi:PadR family transcriptional regulator PadR